MFRKIPNFKKIHLFLSLYFMSTTMLLHATPTLLPPAPFIPSSHEKIDPPIFFVPEATPIIPSDFPLNTTNFTTNKAYETQKAPLLKQEKQAETPKKIETTEEYSHDLLSRFPEKTKEEFIHYVGSCLGFEQNITICEPSTCSMGHPIFTFYDPEIKVTKIIDGKIDGKCHYTEYLPQNAYLQCSLSGKGQEIFSKSHHHWMYDLRPNFSLNTPDFMAYKDIIKQECHLYYDLQDAISDTIISPTKGKNISTLPKIGQGKSYLAERKKEVKLFTLPNYHTYLLPGPIAFKKYNTENNHLPAITTLAEAHNAFLNAAKEGNNDGVNAFLKQDFDVNLADDKGNTALTYAVIYDQESTLHLLLMHKADPTLKNNEGKTALHVGASNSSPSILHTLLLYGCNPEAKDNEGKIAIDYTLNQKNLVNLDFLLKQPHAALSEKKLLERAFFASIENGNIFSFNTLLERNIYIDSKNDEGKTPLMMAASAGQSLMVDVLLSKNAKYTMRDPHGHDALYFASHAGNEDIADILLSYKIRDELRHLPVKTLNSEK